MACGVLKSGKWVKQVSWNNMRLCPSSNKFPRRSSIAGMTLIEVMISAMIGALIFAALFMGLSQGYYLIQHQRESLRATQILIGKLETIRLCAWTNSGGLFDPNIVPATFVDSFYPGNLGATNSVLYSGTISVKVNSTPANANNFTFYTLNSSGNIVPTTPPAYSNKMAFVTVTLTWTNYHQLSTLIYRRSMSTYVTQNGFQSYIYSN